MNFIKKFFSKIFSAKKTNMELEIYEQPDVIFELIRKYVKKDYSINIELPENISKIALIASGSSYHSATIAANFMRTHVHCEAQSYYASEVFLAENFDVDTETLYIFISQSGETADTNKSLERISSKTDKILAITNTKNSTLYNSAKYRLLIHAGVEKSIASTKAMCAQMFCLFLVAAKLMQKKELPSISFLDELLNVPEYVKNAFIHRKEIKEYAKSLSEYDNAAVLASGMFYPLAKESALKIKETSYINTTAYPTGEFLHGHIAILNKKCAVISFINNKNVEFTLDVLNNIYKNYKTHSLIISAKDLPQNQFQENVLYVKTASDIDFIFSTLVITQLLAFETAVCLGRDIDKPVGLSKIVK
ncbi:MAG: SIS domain-containing protein [Candidatus Gastranaerophilales bacterium]|nr:SIS domain-containing protein [Candidatus Gastranaerophilales bacterium]